MLVFYNERGAASSIGSRVGISNVCYSGLEGCIRIVGSRVVGGERCFSWGRGIVWVVGMIALVGLND